MEEHHNQPVTYAVCTISMSKGYWRQVSAIFVNKEDCLSDIGMWKRAGRGTNVMIVWAEGWHVAWALSWMPIPIYWKWCWERFRLLRGSAEKTQDQLVLCLREGRRESVQIHSPWSSKSFSFCKISFQVLRTEGRNKMRVNPLTGAPPRITW